MSPDQNAPRVWREEFPIHSYEIGPSAFATPQAVCRFLQEAASNHAGSLAVSAEEMARQEQMWVLSQLSLRMQTYPRWRETLVVETWTVDGGGIRGYRDFVLRGGADGAVLGRASTMWLLLSKATMRPLKIPQYLRDVAGAGHEQPILQAVSESDFAGAGAGAAAAQQEFVIRASDIDWNMHVNNVCYLEWALEAVPALFRLHNKITALDIAFVGEARYGNSVMAEYFPGADDHSIGLHRILDQATGKVLAMLRVHWQPKSSG